jgi:hypothetical protein
LRQSDSLLTPEPVAVWTQSADSRPVIDAVLRLYGAANAGERRGAPAAIVSLERLATLSEATRAVLVESGPLFLFPEREGALARDTAFALRTVTGMALNTSESRQAREYRFEPHADIAPFVGMTLLEDAPRIVSSVERPVSPAVPLVSAEPGCVFLSTVARGHPVFLSFVTLAHDRAGPLKKEFRAGRFMGSLPLMHFVRRALGDAAWRTPELRACFMIDDPNLRLRRYGRLDLRELEAAALEYDFHVSIAMIPLDYRKTRPGAADLFRKHPDRLSLVMHGVDHLKREFEANVPEPAAESKLALGIARMEAHRRLTGIDHAHAMTFPHGVCGPTWLSAMRNVGLDAAIASRAHPFRDEAHIADPLYECRPAETSFRGFPVVNRFKAEEAKEGLLFQSWLGKPLIVYTHHEFFREGVTPLVEIAKFLDARVNPRWESPAQILRSNYQVRERAGQVAVSIFSNRVVLPAQLSERLVSLLKPGEDFQPDERASANSSEITLAHVPGIGLLASLGDMAPGDLDVRMGPARNAAEPSSLRPALRSRLRRLATEMRDQALGLIG